MKSWKELRPQVVTDPDRVAAYRQQLEAEVAAYRLAEIREERKLTQGQVARELGVNQSNVSRLETGEVSSSLVGTLAAYVAALGGKLRIVADFEDEQKSIDIVVLDDPEPAHSSSHHVKRGLSAAVGKRHMAGR